MADLNGDGKESLVEKIQGIGQAIGEKAGELLDSDVAQNIIHGAGDAAKKVTGGKFDEQIDNVVDKIDGPNN